MKKINSIKLRIYIKLHSYLYRKISLLSTKMNNGIHPKHRILNYHEFFSNEIKKDSKVLDIGCGKGILTYDIAKKSKFVLGIDINKNSIDIAKKNFHRDNIKYIVADCTKYNFREKFDYIILSNVLEHIKERVVLLNKLKQYCNIFLIRIPIINRNWLTIYKKELGLEYMLTKSHYIEYTLASFKKELEKAELVIDYHSIQFSEIWSKVIKI